MYAEAFTGLIDGVLTFVRVINPFDPAAGKAWSSDGSFPIVTIFDVEDIKYFTDEYEGYLSVHGSKIF